MTDRRLSIPVFLFIGILIVLASCQAAESSPETATPSPPSATPPLAVTRLPERTPIPSTVKESALSDIRRRGELRVGVLYNSPPFGYLADNGEIRGYEVGLARRVAQRWGLEVTFIQVTRQTRLPLLYAGEVDMLGAAMPHRRELEQFVTFTDTTFRSGYVMLVPQGGTINGPEALGSATVGVVSADAGEAVMLRAAQLGVVLTVQEFRSLGDAVVALKERGIIQAIVGRREDMMLVAQSVDDVEIANEFISVEPYAFAVRKGDTPLRDLVNLTLQEIVREGEYSDLFRENFYGYAVDLFLTLPGESSFTYEKFPTSLPATDGVLARLSRGEPLRVAGMNLTAEPEPFDGRPIVDGFNRAVINEMARRWNVSVIEAPDSVGLSGLEMLARGEVELVVGIRPELSLIGRYALSQAYYQSGLRMIFLRDVAVNGIGDLEFKPAMAIAPVDISRDLIEDNNGFPQVETADSYTDALEALLARGVYAVVGDEFTLALMAQTDGRIVTDPRYYRPVAYAMSLPAHDTDFLALVNFTLQDMKADGTLDRLQQQYFGPYHPDDDPLQPFPLDIWPGDGGYLGVGG